MQTLKSQDVIYLKNGGEIKAKVLSVDQDWIVTYKTWGNVEGPDYKLNGKQEALKIIYSNGSTFTFNNENTEGDENKPVNIAALITPGKVQVDRHSRFILFGIAPSFAFGSFGSISGDVPEFASTGFAFKMDVGGNFDRKKIIGLNTTLAVVRSPGKESEFAKTIGAAQDTVEYSGFLNTFLITGLLVTAWVKNKVAIDFNIQPLGLNISTMKETVFFDAAGDEITLYKTTSTGYAIKLGVASRIQIKKHLVLTGFIDLIRGHVVHEKVSGQVNGYMIYYKDVQSNPMVINIGLGFGFGFNPL